MRSRLSRTTEKKTKKQLYLSLIGIVAVLFVLFKFGIPALTGLSLFLSSFSSSGSSSDSQNITTTVLSSPILNEPFTATNSATIIVGGSAAPNESIQLYVNGTLIDSKPTAKDGNFAFADVTLSQQQNSIQAKAVQGKSSSSMSDSWNVAYLQKAPSLTVDAPHDGDTIGTGSIAVTGKTDPNDKVTVNGFWAIVDGQGNYSYTLNLQNGDTTITVVATDAAGNTTTRSLTVHHSQ